MNSQGHNFLNEEKYLIMVSGPILHVLGLWLLFYYKIHEPFLKAIAMVFMYIFFYTLKWRMKRVKNGGFVHTPSAECSKLVLLGFNL